MRDMSFLTENAQREFKALRQITEFFSLEDYCYSKCHCCLPIDDRFIEAVQLVTSLGRAIRGMNLWFSGFSGFERDGYGHYFIHFDFEDLDPECDEETGMSAMDYRIQELQEFFEMKDVEQYKIGKGGYQFINLDYVVKL